MNRIEQRLNSQIWNLNFWWGIHLNQPSSTLRYNEWNVCIVHHNENYVLKLYLGHLWVKICFVFAATSFARDAKHPTVKWEGSRGGEDVTWTLISFISISGLNKYFRFVSTGMSSVKEHILSVFWGNLFFHKKCPNSDAHPHVNK